MYRKETDIAKTKVDVLRLLDVLLGAATIFSVNHVK